MNDTRPIGPVIRRLRRERGMTQADLAQKLDISPSYLNLIENGRRPPTADVLLRMAARLGLDLGALQRDGAVVESDLIESLSDPMFDDLKLTAAEVREAAQTHPNVARAFTKLYRAFTDARRSAERLAERLTDDDDETPDEGGLLMASEAVSDLLQSHSNHFPQLEAAAERVWADAELGTENLYSRLVAYIERAHGVRIVVRAMGPNPRSLRRFDPPSRTLELSDALPFRSRTFQIAHQLALLTLETEMGHIAAHRNLGDDAKRLLRVVLANYFAAAVMMPYDAFRAAAEAERYDIEVLSHRFRSGFEQVCHRLTTLRRPGAEGVPFHFLRVDTAGNISKRFSGSGIRFARYSGACPRWVVFRAGQTPGAIQVQISRMPDGATYFSIARTIHREMGGWHTRRAIMAVELGCELKYARRLVYADGLDLAAYTTAVPVGVTCRLCEREDCDQRALPSVFAPLRIDENVRTASTYMPPAAEPGTG